MPTFAVSSWALNESCDDIRMKEEEEEEEMVVS
jgi:hypothetical protein